MRADAVSRNFGYRRIIHDINLTLHGGDVVALLGPNGAGKTTLLRVLGGLLRPTTGTVKRHSTVSMVLHQSMLYDVFTARENLRFYGKLYGVNGGRVDELLETVGLQEFADTRVGTYSRGMLQRLTIARALLPDPELLLLDEPFSGLDDNAKKIVMSLISSFSANRCGVVLVSHDVYLALQVATSVGFLIDGTLKAVRRVSDTNPDALAQEYRRYLNGE